MNGKQRRDKSALPQTAGHFSQREKQQSGGDGVQQHVSQMMSSRLQTVQLTVQHVRHDSERMPVTAHSVRKGPNHALWRKPRGNLRILIDILRVIVGDKVVS